MSISDKQGAAGKVAAPIERILGMMAGPKVADLSLAAATARQSVKYKAWLEKRGRLDERTSKVLDDRIADDTARFEAAAQQVLAVTAIPPSKPGSMTVGGTVTRSGKPQDGLVVSLIGRDGKTFGCGTTDGYGRYTVVYDKGDEALALVSTAKGKELLLDNRPVGFVAGGVKMLDLELETKRECPGGPDTSGWKAMPDLIGLDADKAIAELKQRKIDLAGRKTAIKPGFEGKVVKTEPGPGELLADPPTAVLVIGKTGRSSTDRQPDTPVKAA